MAFSRSGQRPGAHSSPPFSASGYSLARPGQPEHPRPARTLGWQVTVWFSLQPSAGRQHTGRARGPVLPPVVFRFQEAASLKGDKGCFAAGPRERAQRFTSAHRSRRWLFISPSLHILTPLGSGGRGADGPAPRVSLSRAPFLYGVCQNCSRPCRLARTAEFQALSALWARARSGVQSLAALWASRRARWGRGTFSPPLGALMRTVVQAQYSIL